MSQNWYSTEILPLDRPLLSKEDFVKLYLPQYARDYKSPTGIRMVKGVSGNFHVQMSTPGSHKAQVTKRQNRIDMEYEKYLAVKNCQIELDREHSEPTFGI